jgi:hypothetical protein
MASWQSSVTLAELEAVYVSWQHFLMVGGSIWDLYRQKPLLCAAWSRALQPWKEQSEAAAIMLRQMEFAALYQQEAEQQAQRRTTATGIIHDYRFSEV